MGAAGRSGVLRDATTLLLLAAGCGGIASQDESDASGDAAKYADASAGSRVDASADARVDASVDASVDVRSTDAGVDVGARQNDGASNVFPPEAAAPGADAGECNASTCPAGCCDGDGHCQSGSPTFCGTGGFACQVCPPGMQCQGNVYCACTRASCPNGCCNDSFVPGMADSGAACLAGTSDMACGGGAADCLDCTFNGITGTGGTCANQLCTYPPPCTCMTGCCDRSGQCQAGASNTQCGELGGYCRDCTLSGTQCDMGQCTGGLDGGAATRKRAPTGAAMSSTNASQEYPSRAAATWASGATRASAVATGWAIASTVPTMRRAGAEERCASTAPSSAARAVSARAWRLTGPSRVRKRATGAAMRTTIASSGSPTRSAGASAPRAPTAPRSVRRRPATSARRQGHAPASRRNARRRTRVAPPSWKSRHR